MRGLRQVLAALMAVSLAAACSDEPSSDEAQPLRGMFRYMADAARFRDCRTNQEYPVAMEGAYIDVERAYSNSGIEPGAELMIEVVGHYQERPSMEGNHSEINLIVDSFNNLLPDTTCATEAPSP